MRVGVHAVPNVYINGIHGLMVIARASGFDVITIPFGVYWGP